MALFTAAKGFKTLDFQSNNTTRKTVSVSGNTQRIKTGNQFWSFKIKSPLMSRGDFMADYSFIVQQDGQYGSFTVVPPEIGSTRGTATNLVTVSDLTSTDPLYNPTAGSSNVGVTGVAGTLKKGDLIKFSNHDKVYMLTADTDLGDSSVDVLSFYPALTTAVTSSHTVTYINVPIKVYLDSNTQKYITQTDGKYKYELVLNEDI